MMSVESPAKGRFCWALQATSNRLHFNQSEMGSHYHILSYSCITCLCLKKISLFSVWIEVGGEQEAENKLMKTTAIRREQGDQLGGCCNTPGRKWWVA